MTEETTNCEHNNVVRDYFAELPGVARSTPGDCYCLDCHQPIAADWNYGKPKPITATTEAPA